MKVAHTFSKNEKIFKFLFWTLTVITFPFLLWLWPFAIIGYFIWEYNYYKSDRFLLLKEKLSRYIDECNKMNQHIESLKYTYEGHKQIDHGSAEFHDTSAYNYQRKALQNYNKHISNKYTVDCSLTVLRGARNQPFKYLCKYFGIKPNEENLAKFEDALNNFSAVEQGVQFLKNKRDKIMSGIKSKVPIFIRAFRWKKLEKKLGFEEVDFSDAYVPTYIFSYVSAGGNASGEVRIPLNPNTLDRFINYLGDIVKFRKSAAGQRALMTSSLRQKIKERDDYTCQKCKNTSHKEPNLLLEIDHIIPVSKGGLTSEDNLQTLCWKCNRSKGAKVEK